MKYDIAVAVPTYNRAEYLEEALEAILGQTYPATEIIVVDDGSTDHTPDILARYGKRITAIRITNSGCTVARKTAVDASSSPWLAFCDSDDIWLPHHLERRATLLEKYPAVDFSFANGQFFGPTAVDSCIYDYAPAGWWENLGVANADQCLLLDQGFYVPLLRFNPAWPSTVLLSRALYDKVGGIDPRYAYMVAEDGDIMRKAVLHGTTLCDFAVTVRQRRHAGNTSGSELKSRLGKYQILQNHIQLAIAPKHWHTDIDNAIAETLNDALTMAYYAEDKRLMRDIVSKLGLRRLSGKNRLRCLASMLPPTFLNFYRQIKP